MRKIILYSVMIFGITLSGCLESDDFDGLTDTKPEIAILFPDRMFDQAVGLGFITTGFGSDPSITYKLTLDGGEGLNITRIVRVEGRAGEVNIGNCSSYELIEEDIAVGARSFDYSRNLSFFESSPALCSPVLSVPNVFYELVFTVELSNGRQLVSMPVRGLFKE